MGGMCSSGTLGHSISTSLDLSLEFEGNVVFTPIETAVLEDGWNLIAEDARGFGASIFFKLIQMETQLQRFFKKMTGGRNLELSLLGSHGEHVVNVFPLIIYNIGALQANEITGRLQRMGRQHHGMGISANQLYFLWPILREMLRDRLGDKFDHIAELAWKHLFDFIHYHMSKGIKLAEAEEKRSWRFM